MPRQTVNTIDYAGFTCAGIHSSQFGLYSVTNGDRYQRYLSPVTSLQTGENGARNGTLYFGHQYTQQTFQFIMATDSVTEQEVREIKQWLCNDIQPLILDETPYIVHYVRVSGQPQFNFLPFDLLEEIEVKELLHNHNLNSEEQPLPQKSKGRLYKGDFTVSFIAYEPFGYSVKKWLDDYDDLNKNEWAIASGLKENQNLNGTPHWDVFNNTNGVLPLYNAGDLETDFILTFNVSSSAHNIVISLAEDPKRYLTLEIPAIPTENTRLIKIDTKKHLVLLDNKIGNNYIINGDFFKIPIGESSLTLPMDLTEVNIDYRYRYL